MPRTRLATAAVSITALALGAGAATAARADGVWIDGKVYVLLTGPPPPGASHRVPLYAIAPVDASHPLHPLADARRHGFGAHDHVLGAAARAAGFAGVCELELVVPGPNAAVGKTALARRTLTPAGPRPLLYAVRLGGSVVRLTAASAIARAARARLATIVDTGTRIACHVRPR